MQMGFSSFVWSYYDVVLFPLVFAIYRIMTSNFEHAEWAYYDDGHLILFKLKDP